MLKNIYLKIKVKKILFLRLIMPQFPTKNITSKENTVKQCTMITQAVYHSIRIWSKKKVFRLEILYSTQSKKNQWSMITIKTLFLKEVSPRKLFQL